MMKTSLFASVTVFLFLFGGAVNAKQEGALVIVGGGKMPADVREVFFNLAGGKNQARIVVLPTASAAADEPKPDDSFLKAWRDLGPASVQLMHTRDRKMADDPVFVKPLLNATAVWMSGGDQNQLINAYRGTLLEKELHKLFDRGGVLGGTSAGAAVMSDLMIQGGKSESRTGPGFGFLKGFVVDTHFVVRDRIARLRGVLTKNKDFGGLGIDESTAAIIRGQFLTIKGSSTVTAIWSQSSRQPTQERTLKAGSVLDLASLRATSKPK